MHFAKILAALEVLLPNHYGHVVKSQGAGWDGILPGGIPRKLLSAPASVGVLFDAAYYVASAALLGLPPPALGESALSHWLRLGAVRNVVPTPWFNEAFYLENNPDVASAGLFGFVHFVRFGMREHRRPNVWFDPVWYEQVAGQQHAEMPLFQRFLLHGADIGASPTRGLRLLRWRQLTQDALLEQCRAVDEILDPLRGLLGAAGIDRLCSLFQAPVYREQAGLPAATTDVQALGHFARDGLWRGLPCSKLFDASTYVSSLRSHSLPALNRDEPAVLHWIRHGEAAGLVPVKWFDAGYYLASHPELAHAKVLPFTHYLDHGLFEERAPTRWFDSAHYISRAQDRPAHVPGFLHFLLHGRALGLAPTSEMQWLGLREADVEALNALYPRLRSRLHALENNLAHGMMRHFFALFVPEYYARQAGLPRATLAIEALLHFLETGMGEGVDPSPLFDGAFYRAAAELHPNLPAIWHTPLLVHFLKYGLHQRVVPSPLFDPAFYMRFHTDLDPVHVFSYEHFILHGIGEGRRPTVWFEQSFCGGRLEYDPSTPPYLRALLSGLDLGVVPSAALSRLLGTVAAPGCISLARYRQLMVASLAWSGGRLDDALLLFVPEGYDGGGDLAAEADTLERLIHFLTTGLARGDDIGPLLEPVTYLANLARAGLPPPEGPLPLHFAEIGQVQRVLPTSQFDETSYLTLYPDIADGWMWSFVHFLQHGLYEGRRASRGVSVQLDMPLGPGGGPAARRRLLVAAGIVPADTRQADLAYAGWMLDSQTVLREALAAPETAASVAQMRVFEPGIGDLADIATIMVPPFHDPISAPHRAMLARLQHHHYDTIVCVPWIRNGGADLVAGSFTFALRRTRPDERVLLLRTDNPHFDRPDWIAPDVDVLDLSDIFTGAGPAIAERLLNALFLGLSPRRIVNINSLLCWRTYRRFGRRTAERVKLYAYLFCWDQTKAGVRIGYPSDYYPETAAFMAGVFTDTQYLKDELTRMYMLPQALQARLSPLFSPARLQASRPTMAELGAASAGRRARPVVLWGGRLDYQKRFDIVEAVAWRMPEVDFLCWGAALLDAGPNPARLPPNITMRGAFQALTDLPLGDSDGWLFTSAWEGMPTTVIELATLGMPMVCSGVGGVPDLIDETTGWLVPPDAPAEVYAAAVHEMVSRPDLRIARGHRVQAMALTIFTTANYDQSLAAVLDAETAVVEALA